MLNKQVMIDIFTKLLFKSKKSLDISFTFVLCSLLLIDKILIAVSEKSHAYTLKPLLDKYITSWLIPHPGINIFLEVLSLIDLDQFTKYRILNL